MEKSLKVRLGFLIIFLVLIFVILLIILVPLFAIDTIGVGLIPNQNPNDPTSMPNHIHRGDYLVITTINPEDPEELQTGDIIAVNIYKEGGEQIITHRVQAVLRDNKSIIIKGDHPALTEPDFDLEDGYLISFDQIIGKVSHNLKQTYAPIMSVTHKYFTQTPFIMGIITILTVLGLLTLMHSPPDPNSDKYDQSDELPELNLSDILRSLLPWLVVIILIISLLTTLQIYTKTPRNDNYAKVIKIENDRSIDLTDTLNSNFDRDISYMIFELSIQVTTLYPIYGKMQLLNVSTGDRISKIMRFELTNQGINNFSIAMVMIDRTIQDCLQVDYRLSLFVDTVLLLQQLVDYPGNATFNPPGGSCLSPTEYN